VVERSLKFTALELFGARGRPGEYRLRGSRVAVALRHRSRDVEILDEIFVDPSVYAPPPPAAALLRGKPQRVLDLGGNIGLFAAFVLKEYEVASLTTFEPDPSNLRVLQRCRAANGGDRWRVVEACASSRTGLVRFQADSYADSHVDFGSSQAAIEVRCVDVFPYFAEADFVKIDIEGSEWELLGDKRFTRIAPAVVVMEWHARNCPALDAYAAAVLALETGGYTVVGQDDGWPHGMIWGWRAPGPAGHRRLDDGDLSRTGHGSGL